MLRSLQVERLPDVVMKYHNINWRGKNRENYIEQIWLALDKLIEKGVIVQYEAKKSTRIKVLNDVK